MFGELPRGLLFTHQYSTWGFAGHFGLIRMNYPRISRRLSPMSSAGQYQLAGGWLWVPGRWLQEASYHYGNITWVVMRLISPANQVDCLADKRRNYQVDYWSDVWRNHLTHDASNHRQLAGVLKTLFSATIQALHYRPFVSGFHRWPVESPHKGPVMRKVFPCHDIIMPGDYFEQKINNTY